MQNTTQKHERRSLPPLWPHICASSGPVYIWRARVWRLCAFLSVFRDRADRRLTPNIRYCRLRGWNSPTTTPTEAEALFVRRSHISHTVRRMSAKWARVDVQVCRFRFWEIRVFILLNVHWSFIFDENRTLILRIFVLRLALALIKFRFPNYCSFAPKPWNL